MLLPVRALEVAGQERVDGVQVERASPARAGTSPVLSDGSVWPANRALPLSVRQRTSYVAVAQVEQHGVRAALVVRARADRRAEAVLVVLAAGQRDDRGQLAAAVVELVLEVPVEHVVEDRQRGGIAGPGADDDLLGGRRLGVGSSSICLPSSR